MSSSLILLSAVTITRNNTEGLARTVRSFEAWRAIGVEHVVVDGSDESCRGKNLALCAQFGVRYLYRKPAGISDAFNYGLDEVHGKWVWFVNGGDAVHEQLEPAWLLRLLSASAAGVTTGGIQFDGEPQVRFAPKLSDRWPLLSCWLPHPATLVKRELLITAGGFDSGYAIAMDYDLWFRLLRRGVSVDVLSIPLARFELGGVSNQDRTHLRLLHEESRIILRNWRHLFGQSFRTLVSVAERVLRALRSYLRT